MNKQQRRELGEQMDILNPLIAQIDELVEDLDGEEPAGTAADYVQQLPDMVSALEAVQSVVDDQKCDEEDKLGNMPESLRDGEKGENAREIIDYLEQAVHQLQETIDLFNKPHAEPFTDFIDDLRDGVSFISEAIDQIDSAISV